MAFRNSITVSMAVLLRDLSLLHHSGSRLLVSFLFHHVEPCERQQPRTCTCSSGEASEVAAAGTDAPGTRNLRLKRWAVRNESSSKSQRCGRGTRSMPKVARRTVAKAAATDLSGVARMIKWGYRQAVWRYRASKRRY
jgi:hypothetical protein